MKNKGVIVLCSGGLDSVVTAHYVKKKLGYDKMKFLFFDYGQRNLEAEKSCSLKCAEDLEGEFYEMKSEELDKLSTSLLNKNKEEDWPVLTYTLHSVSEGRDHSVYLLTSYSCVIPKDSVVRIIAVKEGVGLGRIREIPYSSYRSYLYDPMLHPGSPRCPVA